MSTDQSSSSGISGWPWTIVVALTLGAGGFIAQTLPLHSERPPAQGNRRFELTSLQALPARLPDDPFEATDREAPPSKDGKESGRVASAAEIQAAIEFRLKESSSADQGAGGQRASVKVIGAMMFGGNYPEDAESRRRGRYAVIEGLKEDGYGPVDAEHMGLLTLSLPGSALSVAAPLRVPFEWFERSSNRPGSRARSAALVLYLEDGAFGADSIARINALWATLLGPLKSSVVQSPKDAGARAGLSLTLIGPAGTGTLLAIAEAIVRGDQLDVPVSIYSPWATASEAGADSTSEAAATLRAFRAQLAVPGQLLQFYRTIGGDDRLVEKLWQELGRRGISFDGPDSSAPHCKAMLAMVAELDTDYANLIAGEFRSRIKHPCIKVFRYMRGIDGLTGRGRSNETDQQRTASADPSDPTQVENAFASGRYLERADGPAQMDYLRRLAFRLTRLDQEARAAGGAGIRAVGVIGSDVYDKLLVLQALRPAFGSALFFTTDLDIRLTQPAANDWARNVLVASNYSLSLKDRLQGGAPPFRDAYQTSAFLATRMAAGSSHRDILQAVSTGFNGGDPDLKTPVQLYEIGRTVAISLEPKTEQSIDDAVFAPLDPRSVFQPRTIGLGLLVFVAAFVLAAMTMNWPMRVLAALFPSLVDDSPAACTNAKSEECFLRRANRGRVLAAVIAIATLSVLFAVVSVRSGPGSEPLYLFQGVSGWSVQILRALTIVAAGWMIFEIWVRTRDFAYRMEKKLRLPARPGPREGVNGSWRKRLREWVAGPDRPFAARNGRSLGAYYWNELLLRWQPREAVRWIAVVTAAGAGMGWLLDLWLVAPQPWQRDPVLVLLDHVLQGIDSIAGAALVSVVVYVTRVTRGFVNAVTRDDNHWPEDTVRVVAKRDELPPDGVADWIDFLLVKELTKQVSAFVYLPFVFLMLVIVVRSPLFDAGGFPVSFGIVSAVLLAYAWHSAFVLRRAAAETQTQAIRKYEQRLMRLYGDTGSKETESVRAGRISQYQLILERIRQTKEGVYSSFLEQPFLRSLFIPIGGFGGMQLIDALSRM